MDMCYLACAYRTPSGHCGSTGGAATCPHRQKKKTNADRIRAMSDEELAELISERIDCCECEHMYVGEGKPCHNGKTCPDYWLDWLRQEEDHVNLG